MWVRRPDSTATTVYVNEGDIVDDLKGCIIQRYPTSLARTCDPADLRVKLAVKGKKEILFEPDQVVAKLLDQHFPNGSMTMADALVVDTVAVDTSYSPVVAERKHRSVDDSAFNFNSTMLSTEKPTQQNSGHTKNLSTNTTTNDYNSEQQPQSANHNKTKSDPEQSPTTRPAPTVVTTTAPAAESSSASPASSRSTTVTPASATASSQHQFGPTLTSPGSSTSTLKTNSPNNGVLLLPRQFQLPKTKDPSSHKKTNSAEENGHANEKEEANVNKEGGDKHNGTTAANNDNNNSSNDSRATNGNTQNNNDTKSNETTTTNDNNNKNNSANNNNNNANANNNKILQPKIGANKFNIPVLEGVVPQINVLIVEDNVINQKILEAFMRRKKIRSAVAKNGKEAVEKWRQGGFHLVLMDIQLPVMSGIEATKEIRRLEHDNRIGVFSSTDVVKAAKTEDVLDTKFFRSPVIIVALTASSSSADKSEALAAGCNDFLTKPVNLTWLEQKTIEWGCMQALIDFEGWKYWIGREDTKSSSNTTATSNTNNNSNNSPRPAHTSRPRSRSRGRRRTNSSGEKSAMKGLTSLTPLKTPSSPKPPAVKSPEQASSKH